MDADTSISPEALLEHTDWVRRLARSLVFDPDRADDVVQETWRAALETPPRSKTDLRTWLAVVTRNAARSVGRSEARRRVREAGAARGEALPDVTDVLAKAQLQKRVTDALLELDEPYRSTLLLRHFEELKPAQIARRLGRPVNTVRTHIERGHAKLRARLDDEFGGREAWGFALLPLARLPEGAATSAALLPSIGGSILMLKWSLAAIVALIGALAFLQLSDESAPVEQQELALRAPEESSLPALAQETELTAAAPESTRIERAVEPSEPAPAEVAEGASAAMGTEVTGRIVDAAGAPLPDVTLRYFDLRSPRLLDEWLEDGATRVRITEELHDAIRERPELLENLFPKSKDRAGLLAALEGNSPHATDITSDAEGRVQGTLPFSGFDVTTADEGLTLLGSRLHVPAGGEPERLFVVVPLAPLAGWVLAADGDVAQDVELTAHATLDGIRSFPLVLEDTFDEYYRVGYAYDRWQVDVSDADGSFRALRIPVVSGLILRARSRRHGSAELLVDSRPREALELRLTGPSGNGAHLLTGTVLDGNGREVADAQVMIGHQDETTDAAGRFRIEANRLWRGSRLSVLKPGYAPAFLDGLEERLRDDPLAGQDLVLRIGEPTGAIRGVVVDESGKPVEGAYVYLEGGQSLGGPRALAEDVLGGRTSMGIQTDAKGRFVYDGLFRESYGLRVLEMETFLAARIERVTPGSDEIQLVLPTGTGLKRLEGQVVDRHGVGVAAATLELGFTLHESPSSRFTLPLPLGRTDETGHFDFADTPHAYLDLVVRSAGVKEVTFPLEAGRTTGLELPVERLHRFQLQRERFNGFDSVEAIDSAGEVVVLTAFESGMTSVRKLTSLSDASTWPTFEVSDAATELVFYRGGEVALRTPLELEPGVVTSVR